MTEPIRKIYAIKEMLDGPQGVEGWTPTNTRTSQAQLDNELKTIQPR